jgi:hypothetical protein
MTGPRPLDEFHAHEVLHTTSIIAKLFDEQIEQHAFTQADPALFAAAQRISQDLHDFYQLVGSKAY